MRKRQRTIDTHPGAPGPGDPQLHPQPPVPDDGFINDQDAVDSAADDDDEEEKPKSDKKAGRRKIKIEFIQDKSRRHITFSKRKAGIMKKAYELSTLTGTQVLLLVVSETGLVYTFTTAKLQPLVTQPEGKNLIQACLNAPHGTLPSAMPVGTPLGRSSGPMSMPGPGPGANNLPGGLSISGPGGPTSGGGGMKDEDNDAEDDDAPPGKRSRRRGSSTTGPGPAGAGNPRGGGGPTSPHSPAQSIPPPPLSIPPPSQHHQQHPQQHQQQPPSQISLSSPTSPQSQHPQVPTSPAQYGSSYGHGPGGGGSGPGGGGHHQQQPPPGHHPGEQQHGMYGGHMMQPAGPYSYASAPGTQGGPGQQQLPNLAAAAAAQQGHWTQGPPAPQVGQGGHYGRR